MHTCIHAPILSFDCHRGVMYTLARLVAMCGQGRCDGFETGLGRVGRGA